MLFISISPINSLLLGRKFSKNGHNLWTKPQRSTTSFRVFLFPIASRLWAKYEPEWWESLGKCSFDTNHWKPFCTRAVGCKKAASTPKTCRGFPCSISMVCAYNHRNNSLVSEYKIQAFHIPLQREEAQDISTIRLINPWSSFKLCFSDLSHIGYWKLNSD